MMLATVIRQLVEYHDGASPLTFGLEELLRGVNSVSLKSLKDDIMGVLNDYEKAQVGRVPTAEEAYRLANSDS